VPIPVPILCARVLPDFFATFIYMIGFVHDFHFQLGSYYFVPIAIDFGGNTTSTATTFIINVALIGLFGLQQVYQHAKGVESSPIAFMSPGLSSWFAIPSISASSSSRGSPR
jgi:hypothetical protein